MGRRCRAADALQLALAALGLAMGPSPLAYVNGEPVTGLWGAPYLYYAELVHYHYVALLAASVALAAAVAGGAGLDLRLAASAAYMFPAAALALDLGRAPAGALQVYEVVGDGILAARLTVTPSPLAYALDFRGVPVLLLAALAAALYDVACRSRPE